MGGAGVRLDAGEGPRDIPDHNHCDPSDLDSKETGTEIGEIVFWERRGSGEAEAWSKSFCDERFLAGQGNTGDTEHGLLTVTFFLYNRFNVIYVAPATYAPPKNNNNTKHIPKIETFWESLLISDR